MWKKFKNIFEGLDRAYGQYKSSDSKSNGKLGGQSFIRKDLVHDSLWIKHLEGEEPALGIIPITDNSTCRWGCIDVDTYPLDHKDIIKNIEKLHLPLVVCRSKSGGAHLFLFTTDWIPASLMRSTLMEWAGELGHADCEVFPKQIEIRADRGDTGNYLNLPYHGGDNTNRYAFNIDGSGAATLDQFFSLYDKKSIGKDDLSSFKIKKDKKKKNSPLSDGPPCLEILVEKGIEEGGRDNVLYQYAVYAKKKWPDKWQDKISEFNHKHIKTPLGHQQVTKTINQHEKTDYKYKCKDQPMCSVCVSSVCTTRQFGIGGEGVSKIGDLTKIQSDGESIYFLNVDGKRVTLTTQDLTNETKFHEACVEQVNIWPPPRGKNQWRLHVQELLTHCQTEKVDESMTKRGRFKAHLEDFIREQGDALELGDVEINKAYTDEKSGRTFFRLNSLESFLRRRNFHNFSKTRMIQVIKDMNGGDTQKWIECDSKGNKKQVYVWWIPVLQKDDKKLTIPDMKPKRTF
jgi:hypothetical protein|tara:strand:- start:323 stop:1864 length:1542 start_codon:yes stop_codon:yes gene_type:complete